MEMDMKKKMTQQLVMRLAERKNEGERFRERLLTDALVNCVLHDCVWLIPVGLADEMETWYDDGAPADAESVEARIRFDGYEAAVEGPARERFFRRQVLRLQDGSAVPAAYVSEAKNRPGEPGGAPLTAAVPCRTVLRDFLENESARELVLDPGTDDLFLTRERAEFLLHAAERQVTPRPPVGFRMKRGVSCRMTLAAPLEPEAFANVETVLRSLRDMQFEFLVAEIARHEKSAGGYLAEFAQAMYGSGEGLLRVETALTWEMNRVKHRMLLYVEMRTDEAVEYFRELLVLDRIPERTRDFRVYFEDRTEAEEE